MTRQFGANGRAPRIRTVFRAIEFLSDQLSKPAQNSFVTSDRSYLVQTCAAEPFADLTERGALVSRKPKPIRQVCPEYAVLGCKILDLAAATPG